MTDQEESKQVGYPIDPAAPERITSFSIDNSETYAKQDGVDWHVFYTH